MSKKDQMTPKQDLKIDGETLGLLVHSYNNHLAAMMGYTEISLLDCSDDSSREKLALSLEAGEKAVALGNDVLASIGRLQVTMEFVSIETLVAAMKKIEDICFEPENLDEPIYKTLKLQANLKLLLECLNELIDFARWQTQDKVIKIQIETKSDTLKLNILADLIVFNEKDLRCLFDPFYSTRILKGTKDIGLSKVKGFLTQINANVEWKNGVGFSVSIPLNKD